MKADGSGVFPFQLGVFEVPFAVKFRGTKQLLNKKSITELQQFLKLTRPSALFFTFPKTSKTDIYSPRKWAIPKGN